MRSDPPSAERAGHVEAGFTYLGLMILVATLALATSTTLTLGSIAQRREAEQRLLEVGAAYRQAIASYLNSAPGGRRRYPGSLADLLKDPRYPGVRRHLRQLYPDPITGKSEWGLVQAPGGGIMGIHSLSDAPTIKIAGFDAQDQLFEGKTRYSEWVFGILPEVSGLGGETTRQGQSANATAPQSGLTDSQFPDQFAPQNPALTHSQMSAPVPALTGLPAVPVH